MYQALYRKYRPRSFDDVAGQEHITETLKNQVRTGRLSHAYLFIGSRGTGKTTCAKLLARAVNCERPVNGNPCNECPACRGIEDGSILDVVELDAASNNGVDNVRALRDEAVFSPAAVKKRVYIIDEVHMLSMPAFNALLKILEEPPEHLMFILATTELHKVPATILSRCQRHSFKRLSPEAVARRISFVAEREGISVEPQAALLLGRLAEGSLRDGLSLLDQCSAWERVDAEAVLSAMGLGGSNSILQLFKFVSAGRIDEALALFQRLWREGKDPSALLGELCSLMRDILMLKVAPKGGAELLSGVFDEKTLRDFPISKQKLISGIDSIEASLGKMRDARSPRMLAELCLIELSSPDMSSPVNSRENTVPAESPEPAADPPPTPEQRQEVAPPDNPVSEPAQQEPVSATRPEAPEEPAHITDPAPAVTWEAILACLKGALPVGIMSLLEDEYQVEGVMRDGELVLRINKGFAKSMLDKPEVQTKLRACAAELAGGPVPLRMEEMSHSPKPAMDKLEELRKFGNVTFK